MMMVNREKIEGYENLYDYYLSDGKNKIGIIFCGNNDLYFSTFNRNKESEFAITKENMFIYNLFCNLFNDFVNISKSNYSEYQMCKYIDETFDLYKIFNDNEITWISDDSISFDYDSADSIKIIKSEDSFKLKFSFYEDNYPHLRSIRIRNARSRYKPFNMLFMDFFNSLQEYDPRNHQIHIEEYLLDKEIKQLTKKKQ